MRTLALSVRMLAQEFDPRRFRAGIVLRGLGEIHKAGDRLVEASGELCVGELALRIERLMGLREREHVRIDPHAEVLERHAQRPQPTVAAGHRWGRGHEQRVLAVEGLRPKSRNPAGSTVPLCTSIAFCASTASRALKDAVRKEAEKSR